jgi:hypothetical protein
MIEAIFALRDQNGITSKLPCGKRTWSALEARGLVEDDLNPYYHHFYFTPAGRIVARLLTMLSDVPETEKSK